MEPKAIRPKLTWWERLFKLFPKYSFKVQVFRHGVTWPEHHKFTIRAICYWYAKEQCINHLSGIYKCRVRYIGTAYDLELTETKEEI